VVADSPAVRIRLRQLLEGFLEAPKPQYFIASVISGLHDDPESRDARIACLGIKTPSDEHFNRWVLCSAIRSLADDTDAVALLSPFLNLEGESSVVEAAVKAIGRKTEVRPFIRQLAAMEPDSLHNAQMEAIRILAADSGEWAFLRGVLAKLDASEEMRHRLARDYLRAGLLKAFVSEESEDALVARLTDKDGLVRDIAIEALLERATTRPELYERAFKETSAAGRKKLWQRFIDDPALIAELKMRAKEDLPALRQAFFVALSDDDERCVTLRQYFLERAVKEPEHHVVADLVASVARDLLARPKLFELASGTNVRITARVLHAFRDDEMLRKTCRELLTNDDWLDQFRWTSYLEEYFANDDEAKAIALSRLNDPRFLHHNLISLLRDYPPAQEQLLALAMQPFPDLNVKREARRALIGEPQVRKAALEDLKSMDKHTVIGATEVLEDVAEAWTEIAKLHQHEEKRVRQAAYQAAVRLRQPPPVYADLRGGEREPALRRYLVDQINTFKWESEEQLSNILLSVVQDYDWEVRTLAYERLAALPALSRSHEVVEALRIASLGEALSSSSVQTFISDTTEMHQAADPKLFGELVHWVLAKLVSTLPDPAWRAAFVHVDPVNQLFGEIVAIPKHADTTVIRLAKDTFELHRDRDIWPAANTVLAWSVAKRLRAALPRAFVLVCAPLPDSAIASLLWPLAPGEVLMGPILFGFRLFEESAAPPSSVHAS
jgi:hypothetical protein